MTLLERSKQQTKINWKLIRPSPSSHTLEPTSCSHWLDFLCKKPSQTSFQIFWRSKIKKASLKKIVFNNVYLQCFITAKYGNSAKSWKNSSYFHLHYGLTKKIRPFRISNWHPLSCFYLWGIEEYCIVSSTQTQHEGLASCCTCS